MYGVAQREQPLHLFRRIPRSLALKAFVVVGALSSDPPAVVAQEDGAIPGKGIRVIDGDTVQIDGQVVQLHGIDAPELGQLCDRGGDLWECGRESALYLQKLLSFEGPPVRCSPWEGEPDAEAGTEIIVGVCEIGSKEVGLTMVSNGYAVALPESFPDYAQAETQARDAELGLWQSDFVPPWTWREGRGAAIKASDWVRRCTIKGVVGAAGERTYYVPTDEEYAEVSVDPEGDGRMFCSDEEARAAGWTRSIPPAK
jgi:endonuclease YncB( thermonuclease family)